MDRPRKLSRKLEKKTNSEIAMEFLKSFSPNLPYVFAILFLLIIPIWTTYVSPEIERLPSNFFFSSNVVSTDNFYDSENERYVGAQYSKTDYSYSTVSATDETLIIKNLFSVKTPEDEPIFSVERQYAIDRYTGQHVNGLTDRDREGYLFAPRDLQKGEEFTYWHINYDGPAKMKFVAEENLYGLNVYKYETRYEGVDIDQTGNLTYLPGVGETLGINLDPFLELWVEPLTGRLVKYQDNTIAYYYDLESGARLYPWNNFSNRISEESVKDNVDSAQVEKTRFKIVQTYVPFTFFGLSILSLALKKNIRKKIKKIIPENILFKMNGIVIASVALIVLFGWATKTIDVIQLGVLQASTTNPATAMCFVFVAIAILSKSQSNKSKIPIYIGALLQLITLIRFANIFAITSFAIDQVFFKGYVIELGSRMSLFTSVSFFLLGFALIASNFKVLKDLAIITITSVTTLLLSSIAILGYLVEQLDLQNLPFFVFTSSVTAILMIVTSLTILFQFRYTQTVVISAVNSSFIFGILFISILLTILFAGNVEALSERNAEAQFNSESVRITRAIEERLNIYINLLQGGKGLLVSSEDVSRDEWKSYVETLDINKNYPGIQGVGYSIFVQPEDLEAHIQQIRSEGFTDYTVRPEGEREIYTAIVYLEPFDERNQQAFGFDMFQEPTRRSAMEQARDTGEPRASGRITLVQEIDEYVQPGFLIYVPFYENNTPIDTIEQKRENILGYSYSPFRARDFVEGALVNEDDLLDIGMVINDGIVTDESSLIYSDYDSKLEKNEKPKYVGVQTIYLAGRPWTLTFSSTSDYAETQYSRVVPFIVITVGTSISILFTLIIYTFVSSKQRAIVYADKVTEDLQASKAKDEAILSSIGDGLFATDTDGVIILVNNAFENLLGIDKETAIGKRFVDLVEAYNEDGKKLQQSSRTIVSVLKNKSDVIETDVSYKSTNGNIFPVAITVSPIVVGTQVVGAVQVFRDITKEKQIDQAKTEFVSLASHQLRTPLTAIGWYTELLDSEKLPKELKEYQHEIIEATSQMSDLVDALLNVSRIELGTFAVNPELTEIVSVVESVLSEQKVNIQKKNQKIIFDKNLSTPKISVDPKLFRIIYQNLISNAVKYTPENGEITISHTTEGSKLVISVTDTGYGIPETEQKDIFNKMFRASNIKKKDTTGTGLGLYIVKSIVEQSNGKIWFESTVDKGTTFFVELPLSGMKKKEGSKFLE